MTNVDVPRSLKQPLHRTNNRQCLTHSPKTDDKNSVTEHREQLLLLLRTGLETGAGVKLEMNDVTIFDYVIAAFLLVLPSSLPTQTAGRYVHILLPTRNETST